MDTIGASTARSLEQCVALIDAWAQAARTVRSEVIIVAHGGPIATPDDMRFVLQHSKECNGFYGASSMERLPTEVALTRHVAAFKAVAY